MPIALFGSELWILNDACVSLIESFQNYAGKRVKRHFSRGPNTCAFYSLGWIRLERLIEVRKLLFARSKAVFCSRLEEYMVDRARGRANILGSVVFDLLNVSEKFGYQIAYRDTKNLNNSNDIDMTSNDLEMTFNSIFSSYLTFGQSYCHLIILL